MGPPSWEHFIAWLWRQPLVQRLAQRNGTIALVSHGNFLARQPLANCWPHPRNTQCYASTLPGADGPASLQGVQVVYPGPGPEVR